MIIEMCPYAGPGALGKALALAAAHGGHAQQVTLDGVELLIVTGCRPGAGAELESLPGVSRVVRTSHPAHLADRALRPAGTVVRAGALRIGDGDFTLAAGPCAVESATQLHETVQAATAAGASLLRGGAFKPRTSPYSFQGLGASALELLGEHRRRTGLPVVTEVLEPRHVELVGEHADMLQIGTRSMQNFTLLREVGRSGLPVLLKRGMSATLEEWLLAAEYVLAGGNASVVLCERGIRTHETATRFTLDLATVSLAKRRTHLPVLVDPSHATGLAELVPSMTLAAAAAGADGVLLDVHPQPAAARCDGGQALLPHQLRDLAGDLERQLRASGRTLSRVRQRSASPLAAG